MPGWAGMLRIPTARVEVLLPELLHRRQSRRAHVRGVVGRVIDGPDDERALGVDVEDVDAPGCLLEPAEKGSLPCGGAAQDRAVDGAVEDEQDDVPAFV